MLKAGDIAFVANGNKGISVVDLGPSNVILFKNNGQNEYLENNINVYKSTPLSGEVPNAELSG